MAAMVVKPITGWRRLGLNVFITLSVAFLFFWGLPGTAMIKPLIPAVNYLGLWHSWSMFAPTPLKIHFDVRAQVKYQDGTEAEWIAPRMQELSLWERANKERYRKWRERIRLDEYKTVSKETANFIARQMYKNPGNPPVVVKLTRYWVDLPPPVKGDYQPMPKSYTTKNSFTYATIPISVKDL
jgi:hypothetical protein